jgi:hypothetical protein
LDKILISTEKEQMHADQSHESFAKEFERVLNETDTGVRRLSRLTGIPIRTLENWIYGRVQRPRHIEPILKAAQALHLPANDTDRLLMAAGYPSLAELKQRGNSVAPELLADWQVAPNILVGQRSAALPAQHNLPAQTTPFLGRERDYEEVAALLRRPDLRLITVSGLGGAGKTRLAVEAARSLIDWFDHGVYFIPLDNVNSAAGFWEAILDGLHVPADGANPAQKLVEDYLQNKQILLLLDSFEHLLPITAEICRLLSTTRRLRLLVTSRQALDLQSEQLYPLGGLSYREGQASPAYQLFVQIAQRRLPGYTPSAQDAAEIEALCIQVDGLPLALELAATWSDVLSPAQILNHLTQDLQEVWHDAVDRPQRQQSLWDLFDYSWQMLPKPEQEAAIRLSTLRGSFTSSAAMAIAGCDVNVLKLLLQTSVVGRTTGSRMILHPLVRQFLQQQAVSAGYTIEELEERFMEVTLAWVSEESRLLRQTFGTRHYRKLHAEWQNVERAWWLAVERERYELLDACWDLLFYFEARGNWGQGDTFFEATRRQIPQTNRYMQARLDEAQGYLAARLYELPRSIKLAQHSLQTLNDLGIDTDREEAGMYASLIIHVANHALNQTDFSEENKQNLRDIAAGRLAKFAALTNTMADGVKCYSQGDFEGASTAFQNALTVCGPDAYTVPVIRVFLGISLRAQGRESVARQQFTEGLHRGLEIGIYPAIVGATYELEHMRGEESTQRRCQEALESLALQMGSRRTVGHVANAAAMQYLNLGASGRARQITRIGMGMLWDEVDTAERARILSTIAQAYIAFGLIKHAPQVLSLVAPRNS